MADSGLERKPDEDVERNLPLAGSQSAPNLLSSGSEEEKNTSPKTRFVRSGSACPSLTMCLIQHIHITVVLGVAAALYLGYRAYESGLCTVDTVLPALSAISIFFSLYMLALVGLPLMVVFSLRRFQAYRHARRQIASKDMPHPDITAIIPCFLPNEKDIIEDTVKHVLNEVESPGVLKVIVVYNTPTDMPEIEEKLHEMEKRTEYKDGRQLQVIRVHQSKSKAENLNYVLPLTTSKYFVIYDADHHPDSDSLMRMHEKMWESKADIVQGSVYIRDLSQGLMAQMVDAEFFVTYYCIFPAMYLWTRTAVFGGSNALVRKDALGDNQFDHSMQTEDIDLSMRLLLDNKKIVCCPEARSGELVPESLKALYKQRLRWAIGWDQVSFQYFNQIVGTDSISCWKKFCLCYWMYMRWVGQTVCVAVPVLQMYWVHQLRNGKSYPYVHFMQATAMIFVVYVMLAGMAVIEAFCSRGFQKAAYVVFYACIQIFVMFVQACMVLISLFKIFTGKDKGWVVTRRASTVANRNTGMHQSLSAPLLAA